MMAIAGSEEIIKVIQINREEVMNVRTKFHCNPSVCTKMVDGHAVPGATLLTYWLTWLKLCCYQCRLDYKKTFIQSPTSDR